MILPFLEIIEATTPDPNILMWKFADEDKEIKNGAQLTVRESQIALFLNEGKVADIFEPGLHTLNTENIPILTQLKGWKFGFNSPFKADVYFLNTRNFVNNKWGTPAPIMMRDPEFGQVRIRAFGTFDIKIADYKTFFSNYSGTSEQFTIHELRHELRDFIAPKLGEVLAQENISVKDIAGNITELGKKVEPSLKPYFSQFGIELVTFTISSVTLPDEVTVHYDKMTNMNMVSDMNKYTQFQTAEAIGKEGTAINEGMMMGMMMNQMQQGQMPQNNSANQNQPANNDTDDIVSKLQKLKTLFENDLIDADDYKAKKQELIDKM